MYRIRSIDIRNYKSLRNITISPDDVSVYVGANGSGKSNLCDALDFLGEVYRLGMEIAVARKGGYENIAFRRRHRTKQPIVFSIECDIPDARKSTLFKALSKERGEIFLRIRHEFAFVAKTSAIASTYSIVDEKIHVSKVFRSRASKTRVSTHSLFSAWRNEVTYGHKYLSDKRIVLNEFDYIQWLFPIKPGRHRKIPPTSLLFSSLAGYPARERGFPGPEGVRVFQLNPRACRESGAPTPNPELSRYGGNLPVVLSFLKQNYPKAFNDLTASLRTVLPRLESFDPKLDLLNKNFALTFREQGVGRPFTAEDISDGTIQSLAILAILADPRISLVILEEIENSMHPWGIRNLLTSVAKAARNKQVIVTSHSPVAIDSVHPENVSVVNMSVHGGTEITPLNRLSRAIDTEWGQGKFALSQYLDSGAIRESVPTPAS